MKLNQEKLVGSNEMRSFHERQVAKLSTVTDLEKKQKMLVESTFEGVEQVRAFCEQKINELRTKEKEVLGFPGTQKKRIEDLGGSMDAFLKTVSFVGPESSLIGDEIEKIEAEAENAEAGIESRKKIDSWVAGFDLEAHKISQDDFFVENYEGGMNTVDFLKKISDPDSYQNDDSINQLLNSIPPCFSDATFEPDVNGKVGGSSEDFENISRSFSIIAATLEDVPDEMFSDQAKSQLKKIGDVMEYQAWKAKKRAELLGDFGF